MKKVPNCLICKWKVKEQIKGIFSFSNIPSIEKCGAQGNKYLDVAYNNKECIKIFEPCKK